MSFAAMNSSIGCVIAKNQKRAEKIVTAKDGAASAHYTCDDSQPPPPYQASGRHGLRSDPFQLQCPLYTDENVMPSGSSGQVSQSPFILDLIVGQKMAKRLSKKRQIRRQQRIEKVHDAWLKLGLDTRRIVAEGRTNQLPPHFWTPPRYDAEEMNRRLRGLGL